MAVDLFGPKVYYPRALVSIQALFDSQIDGAGLFVQKWDCTPRSVEVTRNNARTADTCRVELDYRDFPMDPRLIKDLQIAVHMESVPDPFFQIAPLPSNLRFVGRVDEPEVTLGPDQETVRFEARDMTGIFMDFKWGGNPIPVANMTLEDVFLLVQFTAAPLTPPAIFIDQKAANYPVDIRLGGREFFTPDKDDTAWDVLCKLCDLFALVPVWNIAVIEVRTAVTFPAIASAFVYGQNVSTLKFHRNLKQKKAIGVKVVGWNPILGQSFEAIYTDPRHKIHERLDERGKPKKTPATLKVAQYSIEGDCNPASLMEIATRLHAEISQGQLVGEIETCDMTDIFGGDLCGLANGDLLICSLSPSDQTAIAAMDPSAAILYLTNPTRPSRMPADVAAALVAAFSASWNKLGVEFYVLEATHRWHSDNGYKLTVRFSDFLLGV